MPVTWMSHLVKGDQMGSAGKFSNTKGNKKKAVQPER